MGKPNWEKRLEAAEKQPSLVRAPKEKQAISY